MDLGDPLATRAATDPDGAAITEGAAVTTWRGLDDEGYLHICDRRTDLVVTGGMNVYAAEVEAVLHAHPDVADAAVIGIPDDDWGQRVHAFVAARPGRELDPSVLDAFVSVRLAGFKRPRSWEVRTELPRTESGKVLRRVLREELEGCRS